eukprot:m.11234 g.11234  ORF g.11234 m.11234 type:complete len:185 (-) comp5552_c0_seq1:1035-1589(-)
MARTRGVNAPWVALAVLAVAVVLVAVPEHGVPSLAGPAHANKPYDSFSAFYPFYKSEHSHRFSRILHVTGTSLVVLFLLLRSPRVFLAMLIAGSLGYAACGALRFMETGILEGLLLLFSYIFFARLITGTSKHAFIAVVIGYAFAWVGHFVYEENRPATFIYPTYSLMGDFTMCFNVYTGRETF